MQVREAYQLPAAKQRERDQARRLEIVSIVVGLCIIGLLALVLGQSQAMKSAWIDDFLGLVPPIAFLIASRIEDRQPNEMFPYGQKRSVSIAFLCAALALFTVGALLLLDSGLKLISREHPTIGTITILGHQFWLGWAMIGALFVSIVPQVILGRMKLPLARSLHDKVLYADADMNKADWLSEGAAIIGILGVGFGYWWADAAAGIFISFEILHDGTRNLRQVVLDLMDRAPVKVGEDTPHPLPRQVREELERLPWVKQAEVRMREEGHVFTGEGFVVPRDDSDLPGKVEKAVQQIEELDWRIYDFAISPVASLNEGSRKNPE